MVAAVTRTKAYRCPRAPIPRPPHHGPTHSPVSSRVNISSLLHGPGFIGPGGDPRLGDPHAYLLLFS